ncbi:MAG: hypothetical protein R2820_05395 [Cyclobacteriaceae bacterium]
MNITDRNHLQTTLPACLNTMRTKGYTEDFEATKEGLKSHQSNHIYAPDELVLKAVFRFEADSDPNNNSIAYFIETEDGRRGVVLDAYGIYANPLVGEIMKKCEEVKG